MFSALIDVAKQTGRAAKEVSVPSACAICHAWPSEPLCLACVARFARPHPRCQRCAILLPAEVTVCGECIVNPPPLDRCIAAVDWSWPFDDCIARFKFGREPGWAAALAPLLSATDGVAAALSDADLLLPLPLATERLRERGFNQALELARRLAPVKTDATLLRRIRNSAPQATLDRAARLGNVRGAFALDPARAHEVAGRHLLLIDDVMTTGATLYEAARTLRASGAAQVCAIVLARTGNPPYGTAS